MQVRQGRLCSVAHGASIHNAYVCDDGWNNAKLAISDKVPDNVHMDKRKHPTTRTTAAAKSNAGGGGAAKDAAARTVVSG